MIRRIIAREKRAEHKRRARNPADGFKFLTVSDADFLPWQAKLLFPVWAAIGLAFYFAYGHRHSHVARGITAVPDVELPGR